MNKDRQYAFYGSLRKGMYNYEARKASFKYLDTVEVKGFDMYSLGPYPFIMESSEPLSKIIVDLFELTNYSTESSIHRMELGAGYKYKEIEISGRTFGIYVFEKEQGTRLAARGGYVPGGDWVKHLQLESENV